MAKQTGEKGEIHFLDILREGIAAPMVILLIVGLLYSIRGSLADALTIITIIAILVPVEVWSEYRAKRAISC